jgi:hypothetical protein
MKYYCYYDKNEEIKVLSENEIVVFYHDEWTLNMTKKLNGNTAYLDANYSLSDCVDDWVHENGAWESD